MEATTNNGRGVRKIQQEAYFLVFVCWSHKVKVSDGLHQCRGVSPGRPDAGPSQSVKADEWNLKEDVAPEQKGATVIL
ncbi:unnamed protein product [Boreogadus saida]